MQRKIQPRSRRSLTVRVVSVLIRTRPRHHLAYHYVSISVCKSINSSYPTGRFGYETG
eukprot:COSAG01_NODE_874_length_12972_cov_15.914343_4_plen_58_part_00